MPKRSYKIVQFHGGLNSNSDPRDIAENELSDLVDVMVDELGKIRMMGGGAVLAGDYAGLVLNTLTGWTGTLIPGRGLFHFSHDRAQAATAGSSASLGASAHYIALYDDADREVWLYGTTGDAWNDDTDSDYHGVILLEESGTAGTGSALPTYYYADGELRISDGNFGADNETTWYGYISRRFFGDGTSGYDAYNGVSAPVNGKLVSTWHSEKAAPIPLSIGDNFEVGPIADFKAADATDPISVFLNPVSGANHTAIGNKCLVTTQSVKCVITTNVGAKTITASSASSGTTDPAWGNFCSVGDIITMEDTASSDLNAPNTHTVAAIDTSSTNVITCESMSAAVTNRICVLHNLTRSGWRNTDSGVAGEDLMNIECAVSTLYDDSKQESPLSVCTTTLDSSDLVSDHGDNWSSLRIDFGAHAGPTDESAGIPVTNPRVSGFNIYMRHDTDEDWYLQAEVDITKGIKGLLDKDYTMWADADHSQDALSAYCRLAGIGTMHKVITFRDSAGYDDNRVNIGFKGASVGFKTAVVTNRMAYVGNVRIRNADGDIRSYPDGILKSFVNKFDSFEEGRRLEALAQDGDEITALEEYADRLLEFKKTKVTLINISQQLEFVEDVYMHKGVSIQGSVCKTDMGIAWANEKGVYFYDGQRVNNLLEKGGRQIIKESTWDSFCGDNPLVGYVSKKRQLIIVDSYNAGKEGAMYLYDFVTQSWIKGSDDTFEDQIKSNFVTNIDGDLVYVHTTGTPRKWVDTAASSAAMVIMTKDMDFGESAITKNVYKVYLTYRGNATHVQAHYGVNGLAPTLTFNNITSGTDGSSTGSGSNAKSIPYDAGVTDWLKAELKPSAAISNINSFRLKFSGDGSNAVASDFEINDITVVYRLKGVR